MHSLLAINEMDVTNLQESLRRVLDYEETKSTKATP